eukprot:196148_1
MNSMVLFYVILWFHIYHAFKYLELRCNPYGNNSNILVRHSPYHPTANNPNVIHNTHANATFGGDSIQYKPSKKPHHHRYREQHHERTHNGIHIIDNVRITPLP